MKSLFISMIAVCFLSLSANAADKTKMPDYDVEKNLEAVKKLNEQISKMDEGKLTEIVNNIKQSSKEFKDITVEEFRKVMNDMLKLQEDAVKKAKQ